MTTRAAGTRAAGTRAAAKGSRSAGARSAGAAVVPGPVSPLVELARTARIVVCCGAGGGGRPPPGAAVALWAAEAGRRTCVLTIDPARRLAQALGLDLLSNAPRPVRAKGVPS